jgi:hypothetical protein
MSEENDNKLNNDFAFGKQNYIFVAVGTVLAIIGYFLMSGGGSDDPTVFSEELFNTQRMYVAPLLILIGLGIVGFGILKKAE